MLILGLLLALKRITKDSLQKLGSDWLRVLTLRVSQFDLESQVEAQINFENFLKMNSWQELQHAAQFIKTEDVRRLNQIVNM